MRRVLVLLLCTLPLAACFGGDDPDGGTAQEAEATDAEAPDDTGAADATDAADAPEPTGVVAEACEVFAGDVVRVVGEPQGPAAATEVRVALEGLAAEGPEEVRDTAAQLVEAVGLAEALLAAEGQEEFEALVEEIGYVRYQEILTYSVGTAEELVAWAAPTCAAGELTWSCADPGSSVLVATTAYVGEIPEISEPAPTTTEGTTGTALDGEPTEPEPVLATPEDVIAEVGGDGEEVEVSRTDDRVEVGWLDRRGLVQETVVVAARDGGWVRVGGDECSNRED